MIQYFTQFWNQFHQHNVTMFFQLDWMMKYKKQNLTFKKLQQVFKKLSKWQFYIIIIFAVNNSFSQLFKNASETTLQFLKRVNLESSCKMKFCTQGMFSVVKNWCGQHRMNIFYQASVKMIKKKSIMLESKSCWSTVFFEVFAILWNT